MNRNTLLCFGEILWDCLPSGLFLGGAPVNVAYHLARLGQPARVITAVGRDPLGDEIKRRLQGWGIPLEGVSTSPRRPTGTVRVRLDAAGKPDFEIVTRVAWDDVRPSRQAIAASRQAAAIIYGSLALRSDANRRHLQRLLRSSQGAMRVFDVNLRPPHDDLALVRRLAAEADLIKLNDEELRRLTPGRRPGALEPRARQLAAATGCRRICVTAGAAGAGVLWDGAWVWQPAQPVRVVDTIGAGDAFLAAFLDALMRRLPVSEGLRRACRLAEFVSSQPGAQPPHPSPVPPQGLGPRAGSAVRPGSKRSRRRG
ncbi:MAG TPA: carbohydrate kinase [Verrucomicrobiales bacterium]|nr:carbohydrate kinase [Verrucomicrobiales bacterium]